MENISDNKVLNKKKSKIYNHNQVFINQLYYMFFRRRRNKYKFNLNFKSRLPLMTKMKKKFIELLDQEQQK